ncbi:MAG: helix-turn-helix domain-containing protein [Defluviitaleaceae bacterium]|nr:helix-turn-helix domain-containing protein [Defluviitaleaceae bacterium]
MRYYKKMLVVLLSVTTVFVLSIMIMFLVINTRTNRTIFDEQIQTNSRQLGEHTDTRLESSVQLARLVAISDHTIRYMTHGEQQQPLHFNRLQLFNYFRTVNIISPVVKNAVAISTFRDEYVIRVDGVGFTPTFLNQFNLTQARLDTLLDSFERAFHSQTAFIAVDGNEGREYIIVRYEPIPMAFNNPIYVFVSYTENQFFSQDILRNTSGFAVFLRDELVAYSGCFSKEAILEADTGQSLPRITSYSVQSTVPGFRFLYLTETPSMITSTFWGILFLGVFTLAGVILLMIQLTKRMHLPIRELLEISGSNYAGDEFDYIKNAMLSIHQSMESMSDEISRNNEWAERMFFLDLLSNKPVGHTNMEKFIPKNNKSYVAIVLKHNKSDDDFDLPQNMMYLFQQKIEQYLAPIINTHPFSKNVDISFDMRALLLATEDINGLAGQLEDALLLAESEHKLDFTAAIGTPVTSLTEISASYMKAQKRLRDGSKHGAKVICMDEPIPSKQDAEKPKKKLDPAIKEKMIQFIKENYVKDISLLDLADHLNLTKNYVSMLFKDVVGNNFKDYLNQTRYEKACELLQENPNRKLKDVAEQVGCNKDILARLFVRYGGMLPSNYQKSVEKESKQ